MEKISNKVPKRRFIVTVPEDFLKRVDEFALHNGFNSRSALVNVALANYINMVEKRGKRSN